MPNDMRSSEYIFTDSSVMHASDAYSTQVFAPKRSLEASAAKLPVMLYIHGGSYTTGESNDYRGGFLVQASNLSVIVITINYRLAQFGFLASSALQSTTTDGSVGNFGIQVGCFSNYFRSI